MTFAYSARCPQFINSSNYGTCRNVKRRSYQIHSISDWSFFSRFGLFTCQLSFFERLNKMAKGSWVWEGYVFSFVAILRTFMCITPWGLTLTGYTRSDKCIKTRCWVLNIFLSCVRRWKSWSVLCYELRSRLCFCNVSLRVIFLVRVISRKEIKI